MRLSIATAVLSITALVACEPKVKPPETPPPPPEVVSFTATPSSVAPGGLVKLEWATKNATSVTLVHAEQGAVAGADALSGSVEVTVPSDALFVLTAKNDRGVAESAALAVAVAAGPKNVIFVANPSEVQAGEPSTLAWSAPGAKSVSLAVKGGDPIDVAEQREVGSVVVRPVGDTTYVLTVDGKSWDANVQVAPAITGFSASSQTATPGAPITLSWQTAGAAKVSLSLAGTGELQSFTDASDVADGSHVYEVPATIDPAAALTFQLAASRADGATQALQQLTVYVTATPSVREWNVPTYALLGGTFTASWKTTGADWVEILHEGTVVFKTATLATADQGTIELPTPTQDARFQLRAVSSRGTAVVGDERTVSPVGVPTVTSFTVSPSPAIAQGSDPVTLAWDVPHARNLRIREVGGRTLTTLEGKTAETGQLTTFPNRDTAYVLEADNAIGNAIVPVTEEIKVTTPTHFTFSPSFAPVGATVMLTGTTLASGGDVEGVPVVKKNDPAEAFVDISTTGTDINYSGPDTSPSLVTLPKVFSTSIHGVPVSADKLSVSINGWFVFRNSTLSGPDASSPFPTTVLDPLAIAPLFDDLRDTSAGEIFYQLDDVGTDQRLIIQWDKVERDGSAGSIITFQTQLYSTGKIVFAYQTIQGASVATASVGIINEDETDATVVPVPAAGDTYSFWFGRSTLPVEVTLTERPVKGRLVIGTNGLLDVETSITNLFVLSEINANPAAAVADGQWIELESRTTRSLDVSGLSLDFGGGNTFVLPAGTTLPPGGHLVLAQSANAGDGVTVDHVYGSSLALAGGSSVSVTSAGLPYTTMGIPAASFPAGSSWQRGTVGAGMTAAPGVTHIDCLAPATATYGTNGQLGTPGTANAPCPRSTYVGSIPANFESIATTGTQLTFAGELDDGIETLNLPVPVVVDGLSFSSLVVGTNGYISLLPLTCNDAYCYSGNKAQPDPTTLPGGLIAPYWDDLQLNAGSGIYWERKVPGLAPNDGYTIVSWEKVSYFDETDDLSFQVKFFDSGDVEFHYGLFSGESGSRATTWFEHPSGAAAFIINVNSTTPGISTNTAYRLAAP